MALVLAVLVYGEHLRHGGWVGDAWVTRAWYVLYPQESFTGTVGHFLDLKSMSSRPANAVYRVLLNEWLGGDMAAWYVWQLVSCVGMCVALYLLLRELSLRFWDAAAVSVLLIVFPASASLWLWSPVVHASLAIILGLVGFLLALRGFRANGRCTWTLHTASVLAFVLSVLLYEICLPLFLASFLLYALRVPRRRALIRWAADCVVLLPIAILVTRSTEARDQGFGGSISHAGDIVGDLPKLGLQKLLPFGSFIIVAAVLLAAFYLAATAVARRCPPRDPLGERQSLTCLADRSSRPRRSPPKCPIRGEDNLRAPQVDRLEPPAARRGARHRAPPLDRPPHALPRQLPVPPSARAALGGPLRVVLHGEPPAPARSAAGSGPASRTRAGCYPGAATASTD